MLSMAQNYLSMELSHWHGIAMRMKWCTKKMPAVYWPSSAQWAVQHHTPNWTETEEATGTCGKGLWSTAVEHGAPETPAGADRVWAIPKSSLLSLASQEPCGLQHLETVLVKRLTRGRKEICLIKATGWLINNMNSNRSWLPSLQYLKRDCLEDTTQRPGAISPASWEVVLHDS